MNLAARKLAYVRWFDSAIFSGPCEIGEIDGPAEMESVGLLISDTDPIVISLDHSLSSDNYRCIIAIPRVNVRRVEYFEVPPCQSE